MGEFASILSTSDVARREKQEEFFTHRRGLAACSSTTRATRANGTQGDTDTSSIIATSQHMTALQRERVQKPTCLAACQGTFPAQVGSQAPPQATAGSDARLMSTLPNSQNPVRQVSQHLAVDPQCKSASPLLQHRPAFGQNISIRTHVFPDSSSNAHRTIVIQS